MGGQTIDSRARVRPFEVVTPVVVEQIIPVSGGKSLGPVEHIGLGLPKPDATVWASDDPKLAALPDELQRTVQRFLEGTRGFAPNETGQVRAALEKLDRATLNTLKRMAVGRHPQRRALKNHAVLQRGVTTAAEVENIVLILSGRLFEQTAATSAIDAVLDRLVSFQASRHRPSESFTGADIEAAYAGLVQALRGQAPTEWSLPRAVQQKLNNALYDLGDQDIGIGGGPVLYLLASDRLMAVPGYTPPPDPSDSNDYYVRGSLIRFTKKLGLYDLRHEMYDLELTYEEGAEMLMSGIEVEIFGTASTGSHAERLLEAAVASGLDGEAFSPLLVTHDDAAVELRLLGAVQTSDFARFMESRWELLQRIDEGGYDLHQVLDLLQSGDWLRNRIESVLLCQAHDGDLSDRFPDVAVAGLVGDELLGHRRSIQDAPHCVASMWEAPLHPKTKAALELDTHALTEWRAQLGDDTAAHAAHLRTVYDQGGFTLRGGRNTKGVDNLAAAMTKLPSLDQPISALAFEETMRAINGTVTEGLRLGGEFYSGDQVGTDGVYRVARQNVQGGGRSFLPGSEVASAMKAFSSWFAEAHRGVLDGTMSPIELAARTYVGFISIHPFQDGNGRTARLLLADVLEHHGLVVPKSAPMLARFGAEASEYKICADDAVRALVEEIARALQEIEDSSANADQRSRGSSLMSS